MNIEREYIHFFLRCGQLIEKRFRSSMQWPKTGRLYALASDPEAIERCRREALKTPEERAAERAAAEALHEKYRIKQPVMPVLHVEEPTPPSPPPVRRFTVPVARRRPPMPAPKR
ncbi:hypothetical protein [Neorhizobium galegae]|uniref:hypothetical protein n=1 Tax=Neorhizobium galegae TaxID=399 RepID=UPI0012FEA40F|nr:hypothetical protein [Neorhizobium galegae]